MTNRKRVWRYLTVPELAFVNFGLVVFVVASLLAWPYMTPGLYLVWIAASGIAVQGPFMAMAWGRKIRTEGTDHCPNTEANNEKILAALTGGSWDSMQTNRVRAEMYRLAHHVTREVPDGERDE